MCTHPCTPPATPQTLPPNLDEVQAQELVALLHVHHMLLPALALIHQPVTEGLVQKVHMMVRHIEQDAPSREGVQLVGKAHLLKQGVR